MFLSGCDFSALKKAWKKHREELSVHCMARCSRAEVQQIALAVG